MRYLTVVSALLICVGCNRLYDTKEEKQDPPENAAQKQRDPEKIIGMTTAEIVDADEALKDPNIRQQGDRKIPIADPLTQSASSYFVITAKISALNLKNAVNQYRALHDKYPSYQELKQMMKENGLQMAKLRPYEMYGYLRQTGEIVILEDIKKKAEHGPTLELEEQ